MQDRLRRQDGKKGSFFFFANPAGEADPAHPVFFFGCVRKVSENQKH
jgi:hypothetical protein